MGRRNKTSGPVAGSTNWESERSMADAEAEADDFFDAEGSGQVSDTKCACGSQEFLLQAYVHVVDGRPRPGYVDVETLTCPQCGREFTAVEAEGDRILRGEFVGYADLDDDDED
jgi:hypothetical protein